MASAGENKRLSNWTMCSRSGAVRSRYGTPRRGLSGRTRRATTGAGAGRIKVVCEFGERWKRWKIIEEVDIGVPEPSTEGACHPPEPFIMVYFRKYVGENHSQPGPEGYYSHP